MIFPGMDPYLEAPSRWVGLDNWLVAHIAEHLQPRLGPRFVASIEERVDVERPVRDFRPDGVVSLRHPPIPSAQATTTIPREDADSAAPPTRHLAQAALRTRISSSRSCRVTYTSLKIDLLRAGRHVVAVPENRVSDPHDDLVRVNRADDQRGLFTLYPRSVRERLPRIAVPLSDQDPDVVIDLQTVLARTYEAGRYRDILRYDRPCVPPLRREDQQRADALIREAGPGD